MCIDPVVALASGKIPRMLIQEKILSLPPASLRRLAMNLVLVNRHARYCVIRFGLRVACVRQGAVTGYVYVRMERKYISIITEMKSKVL